MVTPRRLWLFAIGTLVAGLVIGAGLTWAVLAGSFPFTGHGDAVADRPADSFSISGDLAEPFFPGGSAPLNLSISNPLDTDLVVSDLRVEVDGVDAPNATESLPCSVDDFAVEQMPGPDGLIIAAGSTASLAELGVPSDEWPRVLMLDTESNQDGCKGASFALAYSAVGRILE